MRNLLWLFIAVIFSCSIVNAQDEEKKDEGYVFTVTKQVGNTSVKDQYRSGTCWSFSSNSLIESELIRLGKGEFDLSEMFVVRKSYEDKAKKYVRMHGALNFGGGGALNDNMDVYRNYGMIPESVYKGLVIDEEKHVHGEMDGALGAYLKDIIENRNKKLSPAWFRGFQGLMDAYLGEVPENFEYNGKKYTPRTFADELLGLNPDDYILISSYTHHPFYKKFVLEVPDNWSYGEVYNVKIDELTQILDYAVQNDFTVAWAGDISEKGFSWKNGVAIVPDADFESMSDLEKTKWEEMSSREKNKLLYNFDKPGKEKVITQEMRQEEFDNYETTDDHGMHIVGTATDQIGNRYYILKNSWDSKGHDYEGYMYMSETFVKYKTMSMMLHKDGIPKDLRKKLGI